MKEANTAKRRFELRSSDKIVLGIIAVMIVLIIALNIMQSNGLSLINGALMLYLPVLSMFVQVGWVAYALIRRISRGTVKLIVGCLVGFAMFLVLMLGFTYVSFLANVTIPRQYTKLKSPSGEHTLVVLRILDPNEERIEQRKAARLAADPDGNQEIIAADWGYIYRAYPQGFLGLFYRSNADVEGEVYLTYRDGIAHIAEEGETAEPEPIGAMMLEWLDDGNTAHFYVDNPGVAEGGECFVRF